LVASFGGKNADHEVVIENECLAIELSQRKKAAAAEAAMPRRR
jgi:hypothetical protein